MKTEFMSPPELTSLFENGDIREDCLRGETILVGSIADFLWICEDCKKGNLKRNDKYWLQQRNFEIGNKPNSFIQEGMIYIVDLDNDILNNALFEKENNIVQDLWPKAADFRISPRRSIRYLTIRTTEETTWWSEDVYMQMEEYHSSRD